MGYTDVKIILTEDGSHTLFVTDLDETYHSIHGAIQESRLVFIKQGLEYFLDLGDVKTCSVLEIGFGTGLNALLTYEFYEQHQEINVEYTTLEPFPIDDSLIQELNYAQQTRLKKGAWDNLHMVSWDEVHKLNPNFKFKKIKSSIQNFNTDQSYDLVYFDAFGPGKQPEIWTEEVFKKLNQMMTRGAVLTTYCAQGQFKRTLKSTGFEVESLPGPPGKMEMVRATKL